MIPVRVRQAAPWARLALLALVHIGISVSRTWWLQTVLLRRPRSLNISTPAAAIRASPELVSAGSRHVGQQAHHLRARPSPAERRTCIWFQKFR